MPDWLGDSDGPMGDYGAFMESELQVPRADLASHIRQLPGERLLIGLVGGPGAGKSHLARELAEALGEQSAIVAMDGFHRDNEWLDARGLRNVKGAPETFDTEGFSQLLARLKSSRQDEAVPTFDRDLDATVPGGANVPGSAKYLIVEGNYLLLTRPGWSDLYPLFDLTIRIDLPEQVLRERLTQRWRDQGCDLAETRRRVEENDLPNGRTITRESRAADLVVRD
ncbi:AAA family ATPase [Thioclava nitratireducens]|uniref:AAA family ATPase n=1 Tax=Thioclava nitratireducens TaxID=1915078 RepID=UPI0024807F3E|nr:AAA family ATPase [Thioclava nitratireducens]WGT49995.1 phosphoribulokinase [Thioclava nitratireducens]